MSRHQTRGEGIPKSYRTTSHSLRHSAAGMSTLKGSELYPHPPGRPKHRRVATTSKQAGSQTERDLGTQKDTGPRRGIVRNTRSRRQFPALHSHRQKKATPQKLEYRRPFFCAFDRHGKSSEKSCRKWHTRACTPHTRRSTHPGLIAFFPAVRLE